VGPFEFLTRGLRRTQRLCNAPAKLLSSSDKSLPACLGGVILHLIIFAAVNDNCAIGIVATKLSRWIANRTRFEIQILRQKQRDTELLFRMRSIRLGLSSPPHKAEHAH